MYLSSTPFCKTCTCRTTWWCTDTASWDSRASYGGHAPCISCQRSMSWDTSSQQLWSNGLLIPQLLSNFRAYASPCDRAVSIQVSLSVGPVVHRAPGALGRAAGIGRSILSSFSEVVFVRLLGLGVRQGAPLCGFLLWLSRGGLLIPLFPALGGPPACGGVVIHGAVSSTSRVSSESASVPSVSASSTVGRGGASLAGAGPSGCGVGSGPPISFVIRSSISRSASSSR